MPYDRRQARPDPQHGHHQREERVELRTEIYLVAEAIGKLIHGEKMLATDSMDSSGRIESPGKLVADPSPSSR